MVGFARGHRSQVWPVAPTLGRFLFRGAELQIRAAAVNSESIAEQVFTHGRAFNMPAGRPLPHGLFHAGSPALAAFHNTKNQARIAFETVHFHTLACAPGRPNDLPDNCP